jgi:hypothetical protein
MSTYYANIALKGPAQHDVLAFLKAHGDVAYVSPVVKESLVVFHQDLSTQEDLAARLSAEFICPALLVMNYGQGILLYHLYQDGRQVDAYVSSPHGELELDGPAPAGDAAVLCQAFDADRFERRVATLLAREGKPGQPYEYAANRHGELASALGLPVFAAGTGFDAIELGEVPMGKGFELRELRRS